MITLVDLTGSEYLSYSSLSTYIKCGEEYRLSRIERVPQAPAYWFPGGTAVHKGTEVYDLCIEDGVSHHDALESGIKAFHNTFTAEMQRMDEESDGQSWRAGGRKTKQWPNGEDASFWRFDGPVQVKQYADWRQAHSGLILQGIEIPFEVAIGGVKVRGFIDRTFLDPLGESIVVDLKSGKSVPADYTQLGIYASALEAEGFQRPRYGAYFMTRRAELSDLVDLTRFNEDMLGMWLSQAKRGIESGIFLPHVTSMCATCSVADFCYAKNPDIELPVINMTQEDE